MDFFKKMHEAQQPHRKIEIQHQADEENLFFLIIVPMDDLNKDPKLAEKMYTKLDQVIRESNNSMSKLRKNVDFILK